MTDIILRTERGFIVVANEFTFEVAFTGDSRAEITHRIDGGNVGKDIAFVRGTQVFRVVPGDDHHTPVRKSELERWVKRIR